MVGISGLLTSVKQDRQEISALSSSIASNTATPEIKNVSGPNGTIISKLGRLSSPEKLAQLTAKSSEKGHDEGVNLFMSEIVEIFGDATKPSSLQGSYSAMSDALHIASIDAGSRSKAVNSVSSFFSKAEHVKSSLSNLGSKVDSEVERSIVDINRNLKTIFNNNARLSGDAYVDNPALSSSEDAAASLAEGLLIRYNISSSGRVAIAGNISNLGTNFVDGTSYIQFSYNSNAANPISYAIYDYNGKTSQDIPLEIMQDGKLNINCGGRLEGLLEFKETILPKISQDLSAAIDEVAEGLNIVHNEGVGFPPPTLLTSSRETLGDESIGNASGSVKFLPVGADGRPLASDRSRFNPLNIDLTRCSDVTSLVAAINKEAACDASAGAALGRGVDTQGNAKFLVDQVSADFTVSEGRGEISLRLSSGSDSNAKVRINQLVIDDGNAPAFVVPITSAWTEVKAGETAKSPEIQFNLPAPFQQAVDIYMVVETVGSDGTFSREQVRFNVDSGAGNTLQNYTSANYHQATAIGGGGAPVALNSPAPEGAAVIAAAKSTAQFVRASIADGKMQLGGRVAIIGDGRINGSSFAKYFALNDLVTKGADGKWKLHDDISSNPSRLSLAKAQIERSERVNTLVGLESARATLDFTAGIPADGESVTINGQEFIFRDVPVDPNHVQRTVGDAPATIRALITAVNSSLFPTTSDIVTASVNQTNASMMDIVANHAGIKGNDIEITSAGGGGHRWINAQRPAVGPFGLATSLYGGRSEGTASATANYSLAAGNAAPGDTITINGHQFTFGGGPGQIAVGVNEAATINNIRAHLTSGAFPDITSQITFVANGNVLEMTAANAGSHGNAIQIQCGGVNPVCINATNPAGLSVIPINFEGGTDAFGSRIAQRFGYEVLADNNYNSLAFANPIRFSSGVVKTLDATFVKTKMEISDILENSHNNFEISSEVLEIAKDQFQSARKLKPEEILLMNVQRNALMQAKLMAIQMLQKARAMQTGMLASAA